MYPYIGYYVLPWGLRCPVNTNLTLHTQELCSQNLLEHPYWCSPFLWLLTATTVFTFKFSKHTGNNFLLQVSSVALQQNQQIRVPPVQPFCKSPAFITTWRVVELIGFVLMLGFGVTQLLRRGNLFLFHKFYVSNVSKECRWSWRNRSTYSTKNTLEMTNPLQ